MTEMEIEQQQQQQQHDDQVSSTFCNGTIEVGKWAIFNMPSGNEKLLHLVPSLETIDLGKFGKFQASLILGKRFGESFEILSADKIIPHKREYFMEIEDMNSIHRNNEFSDSNDSQNLIRNEIEDLKRKGQKGEIRGAEIVQMVAANNVSFEKKSEFAQAKYIARKKKKFLRVFTVVQPTAAILCHHFFSRSPGKILSLRRDTLSQMLTLCNAQYGMRTLLFDSTSGLVAAALVERMAGSGSLVVVHEKEHFNGDIVRYLNCGDAKDVIKPIQLYRALRPEIKDQNQTYWRKPPAMSKNDASPEEIEQYQRGLERFNKVIERLEDAKDRYKEGEFDSLVIASKFCPISIFQNFKGKLSFSGTLVIYSEHREPLGELYQLLRKDSEFINVRLTESWMREYQTDPGRMHPEMMTSSSGGYLLSAIRVSCDSE